MSGWVGGRTNKQTGGWVHVWMGGWIDIWVGGQDIQVDRWMGGWVSGWWVQNEEGSKSRRKGAQHTSTPNAPTAKGRHSTAVTSTGPGI